MKKLLLTMLPIFIFIQVNYGQTRYCTPFFSSCKEVSIDKFEINTLKNINTGCNGGYSFFPSTITTNLKQGAFYPLSVVLNDASGQKNAVALYFDFNQDGDFLDTLEFYNLGLGTTNFSDTIRIPLINQGQVRVRIIASRQTTELEAMGSCSQFMTGEAEDYTVSIAPPDPMILVKESLTQNTLPVAKSMRNQQIIGVQIITKNLGNPFIVSGLRFSTKGTTSNFDIANAKLWFTGNKNRFDTTYQVGITAVSPKDTIAFNGRAVLSEDTNFFWLSYDVSEKATIGNVLDAEFLDFTILKSSYLPAVKTLPGNRKIIGSIFMNNKVATTCEAYFFDDGGVNGPYARNVKSVFTIFPTSKENAVQIKLLKYDVCNDGCGIMRIHNGSDTTKPNIGLENIVSPTEFRSTSADGALTFYFDGGGYASGWEMLISCGYNCFYGGLSTKLSITHPECMSDTGKVFVKPEGGTGPFTYTYYKSSNVVTNRLPTYTKLDSTDENISLFPGDYMVQVSDKNSCSDTTHFTVNAMPITRLSSSLQGLSNVSCFGGSDGAIDINVNGASGVPTYTWTGPIVAATQDLTVLKAGSYKVKISDNAGCIRASYTILDGPPLKGGKIIGSQTICYNGDPTRIVNSSLRTAMPSGGKGAWVFGWELSKNPGCVGGWTVIPGADSLTYDPPKGLQETSCYRRSANNFCLPKVYSDTVIVSVLPIPIKPIKPIGATKICKNVISSDYSVSKVRDATSYQWSIEPSTAGSLQIKDTLVNISWATSFAGNVKLTVKGINNCGAGISSDTLQINISSPAPKTGIPTSQKSVNSSAGETICQNSPNTNYATTGAVGATSYQWFLLPRSAGIISGTSTASVVDWSYNFSGAARIVVAGIFECGVGPTSDTLSINVSPLSGGKIGSDTTIGIDQKFVTFINREDAIGSTGLIKYFWEKNEDSVLNIGWQKISDAHLSNYLHSSPINKSTFFRRGAKIPCGIDTIIVYSDTVKVTIPTARIQSEWVTEDLAKFTIFIDGGIAPWEIKVSNGKKIILDTISYLPKINFYSNLGGRYTVVALKDGNGRQGLTEGEVVIDFNLDFPEGFSPNGDALNEEFRILRIQNYPNNELRIYNREGALLYLKENYNNEWNGKDDAGNELPDGTYFFNFRIRENAKIVEEKTGFVQIKR